MATLGAMHHGSKTRGRFTFVAILPPLFICGLFVTIWSTYGIFHLHPTLFAADDSAPLWHWLLAILSQYLTVMAFITYGLAVFTHPGSVPDDPRWRPQDAARQPVDIPQTRESKFSSGHRRYCKWCKVYKPDRTHHCRLCQICVLRMDHHCPWIMNCVGFRNHKYFLLLVIHSWAACLVYVLTILSSLQRAKEQDMDQYARFFTVLCITFAGIMLCGLAAFLGFHVWLTIKGMTTIEFCEKSVANGSRISYSKGLYENMKAVFGDKPWLWLLPVGLPSGDGLDFGDYQDERTSLPYCPSS